MKKFISWRRVSTKKQQKNGLGLEAQEAIINYFVECVCGKIAKEKTAAIYKDIEERKHQLAHNMEEHYICIDDGQGGKIAIKKR